MTELSQSPNKQSKDVEDAVVIEKSASKNKKPAKTGFLWFITLINLLILILVCVGAYWYYSQIAQNESNKESEVVSIQQNLDNQGRSLQGSINQLKQNNQSVESQLAIINQANKQALADMQQSLSTIQQSLASNANTSQALSERVTEISGRRPSDWLLAEANYLVNMAGRKLYLEKDIETSLTLLQEADARLEDLNDPSLFPVRTLISADIQTLGQVNSVSTNAIALTLAGMLPQVSELSLDTLQLPEAKVDQDLSLSEDVSDWRNNLAKTWHAIVDALISIDSVDEPLEPYLAERQQWLIKQQLKHTIDVAQSAALNEQAELYRSSLQQGIDLINEHYLLENSQVSQFLTTLQDLKSIDFSRNYPSSLSSQAALKDILEQRVKGLYSPRKSEQEGSPTPVDSSAIDNNADDSL